MNSIRTCLLLCLFACSWTLTFSQNQGFAYQAVARDATGSPLASQSVLVRALFRSGGPAGAVSYEETHSLNTNDYGLVSTILGQGTVVSGSFDALDWSGTDYNLEIQVNGFTVSNAPMQAVPFAKIATSMSLADLEDVDPAGVANGQVLKWNGSAWTPAPDNGGGGSSQWTTTASNIHYSTGNVGIGDATPAATLTVGEGDKFQVAGADGDVTFTDDDATIRFPATSAPNSPMMLQFASGVQNADRMVLAHSPNFSTWGLQYKDTIDAYRFLASGVSVFSVNLGSQRVGIGEDLPAAKFHVNTNSSTAFPHLLLEEADANDYARLMLQNGSGATNWQVAGLTSVTPGNARLNFFHSSEGNIMTITGEQRVGVRAPNPSHDIHLIHTSGAGSTNASQGLKLQNEGTANQSWTLYTVNNGGELWIYAGTNNVGRFAVTGAYTVISDERLKTNIRPMPSTLSNVMQLEPMTYRYTHQEASANNSLGFLAQSVAPLFPELVNYTAGDGTEATYTMDYAGFSVVAIKAIQEQQAFIEAQAQQLADQEARLQALEAQLAEIRALLEK